MERKRICKLRDLERFIRLNEWNVSGSFEVSVVSKGDALIISKVETNKIKRDEWVKQTNSLIASDKKVRFVNNSDTVIAFYGPKKIASATCNKSDKFDIAFGKSLAFCRLKNLPIPDCVFE